MEIVDLFSGCGGLSLGFQNAGFEIKSAFDKWEPAVKVYRENCSDAVCNFELLVTLQASQFDYIDSTVAGGNLYLYRFTCFNQLGGESEPSLVI